MTGRLRTTARAAIAQARGVPPPLVVMLLTIGSLYLAYRHALPCADGAPEPDVLWRYACYNDIQPLYAGRGFSEGGLPYLDHDVEYPVLIGALMAVVGLPVHALGTSGRLDPALRTLGFETVDEGLVFFWVTAALLVVGALVTTWALLRCRPGRPWDVALWAVSPALVLESSINWDLLAVALTSVALLAWTRGRPGWTGVLLGLGAAAKLYPLLIIGPLVLLCLRAGTPLARRSAVRLVASAVAAWSAVNVPVLVLDPGGWVHAYRFSQERWIDWGSFWFVIDQLGNGLGAGDLVRPLLGTVTSLNWSSLILFLLACLGIAALVRYAPQPPRVAAVAFLVVAAFLLTNKVWSPQFVLWLVPLAVLARPRWGWFLLWQAAEVTYLFSVMRAVLGERDGYALIQASGLRWLAVAVLAGFVVVEALRPERDVVRPGEGLDPDAGILRADDRPTDDRPAGDRPTGNRGDNGSTGREGEDGVLRSSIP
ncbi:MAG: hypothetical protein QG622_1187 [Actinomycetota bacterium]|nr:hypothetical protein [Actinomycetota bacterium]